MSRTALPVIDVQSSLIASADHGSDVVAVIRRLIERARGSGAPVIYLQHCHATYPPMMKGAAGWHIHADVAPKPGEIVIEKTASDGFYQTGLQAELDRLVLRFRRSHRIAAHSSANVGSKGALASI
jgi:nicotinamidase-related amidase